MSENKIQDLCGTGINPGQAIAISGLAYCSDDITSSDAPSSAEIVSAFGAAASKPKGYAGIIDDNGAGTNCVLCVTDGTSWFYTALTKSS